MRIFIVVLTASLLLLQFPLWFGKGGWLKVWDMKQHNQNLGSLVMDKNERNKVLRTDIADLEKSGESVEELARGEWGLVGQGETFVQWDKVEGEDGSPPVGHSNTGTIGTFPPGGKVFKRSP